jgi:hypothetical protein
VGAIVVLLALMVGLFAAPILLSSSNDDDEAATNDDGDRDPTTTTPEPPTEAELDAAVAEASDFVAQERGLEFKQDVPVELLDDDAFTDRLVEDFDADAEEDLADAQVLYEALGIVDPGTDLVGEMREALTGGVIGFYDPEEKKLVVRGAALTPSAKATLVHELTHALDDQHLDLDRPEYDESETDDTDGDGKPDEIPFGLTSLAEGNANRIEEAYKATFTDAEQEQYDEEQAAIGGQIPDVPDFLLQEISLPYLVGPDLVDALYDEGGRERLDAAFGAPPSTSEGVIHPDKYIDGEAAVDVPQPAADAGGEIAWDGGTFGEVHTLLVLLQELDADTAREAATGWGGDRAVAWRDADDRACVRETVVGDTPADTEELHDAWTEWADTAPVEATIDPLADDAPFTVTSCSVGGGATTDSSV